MKETFVLSGAENLFSHANDGDASNNLDDSDSHLKHNVTLKVRGSFFLSFV